MFVPKGQIHNYPAFGLNNGLVPNKRQAIIWTNAGPIHWRIYAALGGDELTHYSAKWRLIHLIKRFKLMFIQHIINSSWLKEKAI